MLPAPDPAVLVVSVLPSRIGVVVMADERQLKVEAADAKGDGGCLRCARISRSKCQVMATGTILLRPVDSVALRADPAPPFPASVSLLRADSSSVALRQN
jgi:hypothetical protein